MHYSCIKQYSNKRYRVRQNSIQLRYIRIRLESQNEILPTYLVALYTHTSVT